MAKGTLFGGYRVWVPDEQGNPLHVGRVSFYVAGSSTPAEVYKDKELSVSWGTTVSVDAHGFVGNSENGVWLSHEHLYKVVVERKVCEDPVTWETVSTTDNVGEIDEQEATPADPYQRFSVDTISALKQVNPSVYPIVYVNGWMEKDDCGEPMQFRWQSGEQHSSDDGHWVNTSYSGAETGCWEQIFEDGDIDVRKFGAIPDSDLTVDNAVRNALRFCTEPHVYTTGDPLRMPRTLKFVKEGYYRLSSSLDFTVYTTSTENGSQLVPVVIYGGVRFTSETSVSLKLSRSVTVLSKDKFTSGSVVPLFSDTDFVYAGWLGTQYNLGKNLIVVPEGIESTYRSYGDCLVLNLNDHSVYSSTFYVGNMKVDKDGISVDGTQYVTFSQESGAKFKFNERVYFSYASADKIVLTKDDSVVECSGGEISFLNWNDLSLGTIVRYTGIETPTITAKKGITVSGTVDFSEATIDNVDTKKLAVRTVYDVDEMDSETSSELHDILWNENPVVGTIVPIQNSSDDTSETIIVETPQKTYGLKGGTICIFICTGRYEYTDSTGKKKIGPLWMTFSGS